MFAIGIRYLNGWAMAAHPDDRARPEWPPHPDRVFMALVAAHFETSGEDAERTALEWLAAQGAPHMAASECEERETVTTFVPVNDKADPIRKGKALMPGGSLPIGRDRQPRQFPVALPEDPVVYLIWPAAEPSSAQRAALDALSHKVTSVGHSASLVQSWVEEHPPAPNLAPVKHSARHRLRVAGPGRLAQLELTYSADTQAYRRLAGEIAEARGPRQRQLKNEMRESFGNREPLPRRPLPALWQGYERVQPERIATKVRTSCLDHQILVFRRVDGRPVPSESVLQLTDALRGAFMKLSGVQPPPEWLCGHHPSGAPSQEPHAAYLALPDVGHDYADGHVMGVALALPRNLDVAERQCSLRPILFDRVGRVKPVFLRMGRLGEWTIALEESESRPRALRPEIWTGEATGGARQWSTVTPIVFDRHPNLHSAEKAPLAGLPLETRKAREQALLAEQAEEIVKTACERSGLPRPESVVLTPVSCHQGAPPALAFPCIQRKTGGNLHHTHAVILFPEPVIGPVLVGAGRYRGYGLCRPMRERGLA